jgi:hypothetical protein
MQVGLAVEGLNKPKRKSIWLTAQGLERGRQLADKLFGTER